MDFAHLLHLGVISSIIPLDVRHVLIIFSDLTCGKQPTLVSH